MAESPGTLIPRGNPLAGSQVACRAASPCEIHAFSGGQPAVGNSAVAQRKARNSRRPPGAPPCAAAWPVRQHLPVAVSRCGRPIRFPRPVRYARFTDGGTPAEAW